MKRIGLLAVFLLLITLSASARITIESTNYSPVPISPGESFQFWFHVKNDSSVEAKNVTANIILSDPQTGRGNFPFLLQEGEERTTTIGTIKQFGTALVSTRILVSKDSLDGEYTIFVNVKEGNNPGTSRPVKITVQARKPQIELTGSSNLEAGLGKKVQAILELTNIGNSRAINILAGVEEDRTVTTAGTVVSREINPVGVSLQYIPELRPNEKTNVALELAINSDAEIKTYTVPITLQWSDENRNEFSKTRYLGVRVQEEPEISVSLSSTDPKPHPGGTSSVTVDLFNGGAAAAKNLIVIVSAPEFITLDTDTFFIGSLDPDDFDSFKVEIKPNTQTTLGNYELTLELKYKNPNLEDRVTNKTIVLSVLSQQEALNQGPLDFAGGLIPLIVVIVIAYLLYRRYWKKKG